MKRIYLLSFQGLTIYSFVIAVVLFGKTIYESSNNDDVPTVYFVYPLLLAVTLVSVASIFSALET